MQLPAGNCLLVKSLTMRSDVVLQGRGKNVTFLRYESNYPIWAMNLDLVGLRNLTLANTGSAVQGALVDAQQQKFSSKRHNQYGIHLPTLVHTKSEFHRDSNGLFTRRLPR